MKNQSPQSETINNNDANLSKGGPIDASDPWRNILDIFSKSESEIEMVSLDLDSEPNGETIEVSESFFLTDDEYDLIKFVVNLDTSKSIPFVESLLAAIAPEKYTLFLENFLTSLSSWKSNVNEFFKNSSADLFGVKNELANTRMTILEEVLKNKILSSHSDNPLKNNLKTSEVVEICDFLYFGGVFKGQSRISVYRRIGKALNHFASDDTYKNTSVNNMDRDKKLLFISKLKEEFEKATNGSVRISLDKK